MLQRHTRKLQESQQEYHKFKRREKLQGFSQQALQNIQQLTADNSSKENQHVDSIEESKSINIVTKENAITRPRYGNMLIFVQTKYFMFSLGPNYCFFFFAYLCFTLATMYLVGFVNISLQSVAFKVVNFLFCWGQNLSYLLVALSNPGVVLPRINNNHPQNQQTNSSPSQILKKPTRHCRHCNALQQGKTYHCRQCDVCIRDFDHHCPWTSKCIGGNNLYRFYFFVCMTPFYIFYYMIVFMVCVANNAMAHHENNLKIHH